MSTEQIRKRKENAERMLRLLHFDGPAARSRLSARCGIRKSSTTTIVNELLESGLLSAENPGYLRSRVSLDGRNRFAGAARLTAEAIHTARVYTDGRTESVWRHALPKRTPAAVRRALVEGFRALGGGSDGRVQGYGVALPGAVDPNRGTVIRSVLFPELQGVALGPDLSRELDAAVLVDNDVRAQLWACAWFDRLLAAADSLLYIGVLDGLGCAMILHGRRVAGGRFAAGEIGHVRAGNEGRRCECGRRDCLETYCGFAGIAREVRAHVPGRRGPLTQADVAALAETDPAVDGVLSRAVQRLANYVAGLAVAMDPRVVVLGSEDERFSRVLSGHLQKHLYKELLGREAGETEIRVAKPAQTTTLQGIGGLVMEAAFRNGGARAEAPGGYDR
jgi:predicted NBD/HSP70 family sugar kinase